MVLEKVAGGLCVVMHDHVHLLFSLVGFHHTLDELIKDTWISCTTTTTNNNKCYRVDQKRPNYDN